jgi:hypothetical protein
MFVPGKPFQPSLIFLGKAGAYSSEAPISWLLTMLKMFARKKQSNFLQAFINYGRKKFYKIEPSSFVSSSKLFHLSKV